MDPALADRVFWNLVVVARADEGTAPEESGALYEWARQLGVTEGRARQIVEEAGRPPLRLRIPSDRAVRPLLMEAILTIAAVDGSIAPREWQVVRRLAAAMQIPEREILRLSRRALRGAGNSPGARAVPGGGSEDVSASDTSAWVEVEAPRIPTTGQTLPPRGLIASDPVLRPLVTPEHVCAYCGRSFVDIRWYPGGCPSCRDRTAQGGTPGDSGRRSEPARAPEQGVRRELFFTSMSVVLLTYGGLHTLRTGIFVYGSRPGRRSWRVPLNPGEEGWFASFYFLLAALMAAWCIGRAVQLHRDGHLRSDMLISIAAGALFMIGLVVLLG